MVIATTSAKCAVQSCGDAKITWWVPAKGGWAPWRAGRNTVSASCSAAHWTWNAKGRQSKTFSLCQPKTNGCTADLRVCQGVPVPVCLSKSRVVDYSGQQCREGPQQQSGDELTDKRALQEGKKKQTKSVDFQTSESRFMPKVCNVKVSHWECRGAWSHWTCLWCSWWWWEWWGRWAGIRAGSWSSRSGRTRELLVLRDFPLKVGGEEKTGHSDHSHT